jgi:uroporphyrin-III C-methyltransferase
MTDNAAPPTSISPPITTAVMPTPERSSSGRVWSMVALVVALMGLVVAGLLWQRLNLTQQELARRSQDAGVEAGQARSMAEQSQQLTQALQARLALAEARLSEVTLQRSQLDELMASLSRSRDDTLVHDLGANLRLAYQQAQLTGNLAPLVAALQSADERIARAAQPRLNPVQRAIAQDLERLQRAPLNDVTAAVMRIDELSRQVDDWPLIHAQPFEVAEVAPMLLASVGDSAASEWVSVFGQWWAQRWDWLWQHATAQFQALVRISRIDSPEAALLAPEQSFFLRENIKLRLLNARLALMARQGDVVRADVQMVQALLQRYFRNDAPQVIDAMAALSRVAEQANDTEVPRPDETWAALAKAAGGQ